MKAVALKAGEMAATSISRLSRLASRGGEGVGKRGAVRVARECSQHLANVAVDPVHKGCVSRRESISPRAIVGSIEHGAKRVLRLHVCLSQPFTGDSHTLTTCGHSTGHSVVKVSLEAGTRADELLAEVVLERRAFDRIKKLVTCFIDGSRTDEAVGTSSECDMSA